MATLLMYETLMTAPTLVVTWALVKSGALTSWMSAWTASLTGHLYTNIIVMMILFCFTTCKRSNWEGKNYYWCHSEHDNCFHSKLGLFLPLLPNSALVFKIVFWRIWEFIVSSLAKINNHFQIIKYISKKSPKTVPYLFNKMYWVLIIHKSQITKLEATPPSLPILWYPAEKSCSTEYIRGSADSK